MSGTSLIRRCLQDRATRLSLGLAAFVVVFAIAAPAFAPRDPQALLGPIYGAPQPGAPLGFDYLGHDVWSRVLAGGRTAVVWSVISAALAWLVGTALGLVAGYSNRVVDQAIVWCADTFHSFPNLILVLLVVSMLGREGWLLVGLVTLTLVPGVARLARGLTQAVARQEFVEAAELLGHSRWRIRVREILPNLLTPLLIHLGTMLSWAVSLLAGLSFLGYGVAPPAADWGLMINENRAGLLLAPWAVLVPTLFVALLSLGANLLAESVGRVAARTGGPAN